MKKVLLAVGHQKLEEHLKANLKPDCLVVGVTTYKEGVYKAVATKNPDILIFRETLQGSEDVLSLIYQIVDNYPSTRIIFLAKDREPGDRLLETLVNYNIYDIIVGEVSAKEIINLARNPNVRADVKQYQLPPSEPRKEVPQTFIPTPVAVPTPIPKASPLPEVQTQTEYAPESDIREEVIEEVAQAVEEPAVMPVIEKPRVSNIPVREPVKEIPVAPVQHAPYEPDQPTDSVPEKKRGLAVLPFLNKSSDKKQNDIPQSLNNPDEEDESEDSGKARGGFFGGIAAKPKELFKKDANNFGDDSGGRIISFIGGRPGVGTTTIALNTAISLAQKGKRVIFLEIDDINPSVSYWYQLFNMNDGLENVLDMLNQKRYSEVEKEIIKMAEYRKSDPLNYKVFPQTLDFLFYSRRYLTRENLHERILPDFKELYLHLAYQLDYDYVIVDINCNANRRNRETAIRYSNKIFSVITQDVSSISYYVADLHNLEHKGLKITNKNHYIINRFGKGSLGQSEIKKWLSTDKVITMQADDKGMIEANYAGVPYIMKYKKNEISNTIGKIVQSITARN